MKLYIEAEVELGDLDSRQLIMLAEIMQREDFSRFVALLRHMPVDIVDARVADTLH